MFGIVGIIMKAAPIGAFGAMAFTIGKFGIGSLAKLGISDGKFLSDLPHLHHRRTRQHRQAVRFQYLQVYPVHQGRAPDRSGHLIIRVRTAADDDRSGKIGCTKSVVGLVIPTGYSFNLDGTLPST